MKPSLTALVALAALGGLVLVPVACSRRDTRPAADAAPTAAAAILPAPTAAELPPPAPAAEPTPPPTPEEIAAFHAPVPK